MIDKRKRPSVYFITSIILLLGFKLRDSHKLSQCSVTLGRCYPILWPFLLPIPPLFSSPLLLFFLPSLVTFPYFPLSFLNSVHPWFWAKVLCKIRWIKYAFVHLALLSPSPAPTSPLYMSFILICFLMGLFETEQ